MYLFVEAWTPKPAWLALSREEREGYVSQVASGMSQLQAAGVQVVGWGFSDDAARGLDLGGEVESPEVVLEHHVNLGS
jgi:hypothetical protein